MNVKTSANTARTSFCRVKFKCQRINKKQSPFLRGGGLEGVEVCLPAETLMQHLWADPGIGLPGPWMWTRPQRAGSDQLPEAVQSSSTLYYSTWLDKSPVKEIGYCYKFEIYSIVCMSKPSCAQSFKLYLEWHISHGFGQVIGLQAVPVVEMFPHKDGHLQRNCGTTEGLENVPI